jgi:hypothetical protein
VDTQDIKSLILGAIWNFNKGTGLPWLDIRLWCTKGPSKGLGALGPKGLEPNYFSYSYDYTALFEFPVTRRQCTVPGSKTYCP